MGSPDWFFWFLKTSPGLLTETRFPVSSVAWVSSVFFYFLLSLLHPDQAQVTNFLGTLPRYHVLNSDDPAHAIWLICGTG